MALARFILFSSIPASRPNLISFKHQPVARLEPIRQKLGAFYAKHVSNKCVIKNNTHKEIHLDASYTLYFIPFLF